MNKNILGSYKEDNHHANTHHLRCILNVLSENKAMNFTEIYTITEIFRYKLTNGLKFLSNINVIQTYKKMNGVKYYFIKEEKK